mgnify:FL=1
MKQLKRALLSTAVLAGLAAGNAYAGTEACFEVLFLPVVVDTLVQFPVFIPGMQSERSCSLNDLPSKTWTPGACNSCQRNKTIGKNSPRWCLIGFISRQLWIEKR